MIDPVIAPELVAGARQLGYELVSVIGRGGMGVVYRARQIDLDRIVALKTVHTDRLDDSSTADRFRREALAVARLHHPNIVQAMNYGVVGSRHYFAMEYVDGPTAADLIARDGPMPAAVAWHYIRQTAGGLLHASNNGVLHRDIKPSNLLVVAPPEGTDRGGGLGMVKVADFGLALMDELSGNDNRLTGSGHLIGSPAYMAPERFEDESQSDHRSDIYSLGITVILLRTGINPFEKKSLAKLVAAKARAIDPGDPLFLKLLPAEARLIADMLQPEPDDRISGYKLLIARIDEILDHLSPAEKAARASDLSDFTESSELAFDRNNGGDADSKAITRDGLEQDTQVTGTIESGVLDPSQNPAGRRARGSTAVSSGSGSISGTTARRVRPPHVGKSATSENADGGRIRRLWDHSARTPRKLWFAALWGVLFITIGVAAAVVLRPSPPGPRIFTQPVENDYLFDGRTLSGFSVGGSMVGAWQLVTDPDGSDALGCTAGRGALSRVITCSRNSVHFRLAVFVRLTNPSAQIDLDFDLTEDDPNSERRTLRIGGESLVIGTKPSDFGPLDVEQMIPLSVDLSQRYYVIHFERQLNDWYLFFEQEPIATIPIDPAPPSGSVRLSNSGQKSDANAGLIRFVIQNQVVGNPSVYLTDLHCSQLVVE